jgi:hypothetical protein
MPKPLPKPAPRWPAVMLTALVLSLIGCATTSVPPVAVCPANPPPPALSEPMPPQSVLAQCAGAYQGMAEVADRLNADRRPHADRGLAEVNKLISVAWLLLIQWPRGLYLHTKLVALAIVAVVAR